MTSSLTKRDHSYIDDQEDEEEEDSWEDMLKGHTLLELYSVVINDFKGDLIQGKIILEINKIFAPSARITTVIFDGNEGKIGEPLSLSGTSEPFMAYGYVDITFALCPEKLVPWTYVLTPEHYIYGGVKTMEIEEENWGKVTLSFQIFTGAMDARVDVRFLGIDDDGKKKYPSHVYGEIHAVGNGHSRNKVELFRKSKEEAEPVNNGKPISLSRCLIAAELGTDLYIDVDLWGFYDSSDAIQTSFDGVFKVRSYPCNRLVEADPPEFESPVGVEVTFVERRADISLEVLLAVVLYAGVHPPRIVGRFKSDARFDPYVPPISWSEPNQFVRNPRKVEHENHPNENTRGGSD